MTNMFNRRLQDMAIMMYKVTNDLLPANIGDLFRKQPSTYNLRNPDFFINKLYIMEDTHSNILGHIHGQNEILMIKK